MFRPVTVPYMKHSNPMSSNVILGSPTKDHKSGNSGLSCRPEFSSLVAEAENIPWSGSRPVLLLLATSLSAPGNPGTHWQRSQKNIIDISLNDFPRLVDFALAHKVSLFSINDLQGGTSRVTHSGWR